MTRKQALDHIRVEVAKHGRITKEATLIYVEHRISHAAMLEAAKEGLRQFQARECEHAKVNPGFQCPKCSAVIL